METFIKFYVQESLPEIHRPEIVAGPELICLDQQMWHTLADMRLEGALVRAFSTCHHEHRVQGIGFGERRRTYVLFTADPMVVSYIVHLVRYNHVPLNRLCNIFST